MRKRTTRPHLRLLLVTALSVAVIWGFAGEAPIVGRAAPGRLAAVDPGFGSSAFEPFVFLHFGDPQLGRADLGAEAARFARAVREANALEPAFVIIAGDFTETGTFGQQYTFERILKRLTVPVVLVAGNHDTFDRRSRAAYRSAFGPEWYTVVYRNCAFLCLNSELPRRSVFREAADRQTAFAEAALAEAAAAGRTHRFVVQHHPPFNRTGLDTMPAGGGSAPYTRRVLALARRCGAPTFLCGHRHTNEVIRSADGALTIYVTSGTAEARGRDRGDYRYRVFRVYADRIEQIAVRLDAPMAVKRRACRLARRPSGTPPPDGFVDLDEVEARGQPPG